MASMMTDGVLVEMTEAEDSEFRAMQAAIRAEVAAQASVLRHQAKIGIHRWGLANGRPTLLADIEAFVVALDAAGDPEPLIWWREASHFERSFPLVDRIGAAFDLAPEQIDDIIAIAAAV